MTEQTPTQWRQSHDGKWQYLAQDGYWYEGERPTPAPPAEPDAVVHDLGTATSSEATPNIPGGSARHAVRSTKRRWIWIAGGTAVVVAVAIVLIVVLNTVGTGGLPPGTSLSAFEAKILSTVQSSGTDGFDTPSANSVSCVMPSNWAAGRTFSCYAYNSHGRAVGEVNGTVLPTSAGDTANWNSDWTPSG
jgi:hypothetical protein